MRLYASASVFSLSSNDLGSTPANRAAPRAAVSQAIWICLISGSMSKINRCCSRLSGWTPFAFACASPFFSTSERLVSARRNTGTVAWYIEMVMVLLQEWIGTRISSTVRVERSDAKLREVATRDGCRPSISTLRVYAQGERVAGKIGSTRAAQDPRRQSKQCAQQVEHAVHRDAEQAERQRHQPDQRPQHQREQRQRPAENQQQQPQQESHHCDILTGACTRRSHGDMTDQRQAQVAFGSAAGTCCGMSRVARTVRINAASTSAAAST